ncbi:MAG: DUF4293 domain-containing protein [Chitinophagaceae bacterium]
MLQRKQSIWLLLAAVAAFLTMNFSFFSGNQLVNGQSTFQDVTARSNTFLLILTVATGLLSLISIFLYKNRKLQLRLTLVAVLVAIIDIVLFFLEAKKFTEGRYTITCVLAFIIPVLLLLSARGIYKDEKLIRNINRLR